MPNKCICTSDKFYQVFNQITNSDECKPCHRQCSKCNGPYNNNCSECIAGILYGGYFPPSTCDCNPGFYDDALQKSKITYCQPCHIFCSSCIHNATYCTGCLENHHGLVWNLSNHSCDCATPNYFLKYDDFLKKQLCITCYPICNNCSGPSPNECNSCLSSSGAIFLPPSTCVCPSKTYFDMNQVRCRSCNALCNECSGESNFECLNGCSQIGLSVKGQPSLCVINCFSTLEGYYKEDKMCKSKYNFKIKIIGCHSECFSCFGPLPFQCITCSNHSLVNFKGSCVDTCPTHYFASDGICIGKFFF